MVSFFRRKRDVSTQSMEKDLLGGIPLDSTGTLVMQLSCEGTITSINGDLHLIQSFEFLAGHSIMDIIHRDEHNRFKAMLQTVLEGNIKISETILLNQDQLQADLSFFPVFSEDGDIKKILCLATDVYEKQTDTLNIMDYIQKFISIPTNLLDYWTLMEKFYMRVKQQKVSLDLIQCRQKEVTF